MMLRNFYSRVPVLKRSSWRSETESVRGRTLPRDGKWLIIFVFLRSGDGCCRFYSVNIFFGLYPIGFKGLSEYRSQSGQLSLILYKEARRDLKMRAIVRR
jgi:hypothetical protein